MSRLAQRTACSQVFHFTEIAMNTPIKPVRLARACHGQRPGAILCGALAIAALLASGPSFAGPAYTWNLSNDMRLDTAGTNPDNTWTYMSGPLTGLHNVSTYVVMPSFQNPCDPNYPTTRCWRSAAGGDPSVMVDDISESFSTLYTSAGVPNMHPGISDESIVRWTSPIAGRIRVLGRFSDVDSYCGDGVVWYIDHGAATIAQGSIQNTGSGSGSVFYQTTSVRKGDTLYFIVTPGGNYACDSTQLDVLIALQK
jgi:hypothetical protein